MTQPSLPSLDVLLAHSAFVRAAARGVLGGDGEVEDVVQETWLRALGRGPEDPGALRGWLSRIARNLAIDVRRRGQRREKREHAVARAEAVPSVEAILEREEARRRLVAALLALDEPYRGTLLLRYYEGLSVPDVARRLDVPLETARTHLRRGLERLRARLGGGSEGRAGAWSMGLVPWALDRGVPAALGGIAMKKVAAGALVLALAGAAVGGGLLLVRDRKASDDETSGLTAQAETARGQPEASGGPELHGTPMDLALPEPVDLDAVDRDRDIHGVVVDGAGKPIPGATLQVVFLPWSRANIMVPNAWEIETLGPSTRSAADGTFVLRMRRGARFDLRATARGFATMDRRGCLAGQRLRLTMTPGATLVLDLVAADGRATRGTRVNVRSLATAERGFNLGAVADVRGQVRFEGLPGPVRLQAKIEPAELGMLYEYIDLPESGERAVRLTLPVGRIVRGRITAAESGEPLPGARVAVGWTGERRVLADANGAYQLTGWNNEHEREMSVSAPGRSCVRVAVGDREAVDVALERGDSVIGRVLGPDGSSMAGTAVALVPSGPRAGSTEGDVGQAQETSADGRFTFHGALRGQGEEHAVVVMAPGMGRVLLDVTPHPGEPGTIDVGDIRLLPGQAIEGRVLDAQGQPCSEVVVVLVGSNADRRRLLEVPSTSERRSAGEAEDLRTDDLGRFRFVDLAAGSYRLRARPVGMPEVDVVVELPPGKDVRDALLTLIAGRPLAVTVIDSQGRPVTSAYVEVDGGPTRVAGALVDAAGRATVLVRPEDKLLRVSQMRMLPDEPHLLALWGIPIPREEDAIVLTMHEAAFITGVVRDAQGKPVPHAQLRVSGAGPAPFLTQAGRAGEFKIELPVGASVDLRVEGVLVPNAGGELREASGELLAVPAGRHGVEVIANVLQMDRTLTVLVLAPDGSPEPGAQVSASLDSVGVLPAGPRTQDGAQRPRVPNSRWATTDDQGRARFTDLTGDAWSVGVNVGQSSALRPKPMLRSRVSVRPDGQEVTIRLREGVAVMGQVVGPNTQALSGAVVGVIPEGKSDPERTVFCSAEGWFQLVLDPEERRPWVLVARTGGGTGGMEGRLELHRPPEGRVRIELQPR